ncbi:MAG: hypothetical protein IKE75_01910 [Bacilli bacterium]|nr:hypothetical protein [Bacilli bacterium]
MKKTKLRIQDYVFEYQKKDLKNASIKIKQGESVTIPTGTITEITTFELTAYDKNKIEYYLEFTINMSKLELEHLTTKLHDISNKIVGTVYLSDSSDNKTGLLDFISVEKENRYRIPSFCWISKDPQNTNKIFVKLLMPNDELYVWFTIVI